MRKSIVVPFLGLIFIVTLAIVLFIGKSYASVVVKPLSPLTPPSTPGPTPTPDPLAPISVLLLGYGGAGHQGGFLTDSMILAFINPKIKKVTLISIPRDLYIKLPLNQNEPPEGVKINAAYALGNDDRKYPEKPRQYTGRAGGGQLAKYAVSRVTGLNVNYFLSLNFAGFVKSIDTLEGVDVNLTEPFTDPMYPITGKENDSCGKSEDDIKALTATLSGELLEKEFTCRWEQLDFPVGNHHLDGTTALKFVRSRHSSYNGSDFGRSNRQRALISAVRDKIFTLGFVPKVIPVINSLRGDLLTDITASDIQKILDLTDNFSGYTISQVALTTKDVLKETKSPDGQYILVPKVNPDSWSSVSSYLAGVMAE